MLRRTMEQRWDDDDRIFLGLKIKRRLLPTIIGGIVGDALGVPVEFKERDLSVKSMIGYGTYNQPPGTWSDDTSLTMCLIENILDKKDEFDLMQKFVAYHDNGYWTPYGEMFDIGRTTVEAIHKFKEGIPANQCGGTSEYDNGNGALMRISPLVFTLWDEFDFQKRVKEIERICYVTHRHPRSTLGCIIYVEFLINLFHSNPPLKAYEMTINQCEDLLKNNEYAKEFAYFERILDKSIIESNRNAITSDGYTVHSLEAAFWCFFNHDNYVDSVLAAVNLGGDTDTIALLTGTMAGMYYKIESIPEEWINQLARKDDVLNTCKRFLTYCYKEADDDKTKGIP